MHLLLALLVWSLRAALRSRGSLALENLALRQQLATYARGQKRPRLKREERAFWVALSRVWAGWRSPLVFVKPATVIAWHRRGFRRYWRWRSRKPGRPRIPEEHIALIRRISSDQPGWGEDRIAEELAIKLGVKHSTSTIRRYMVRRREPRGVQTWRTFIKNHASQIFAIDFLTQYTGAEDRVSWHYRGCSPSASGGLSARRDQLHPQVPVIAAARERPEHGYACAFFACTTISIGSFPPAITT